MEASAASTETERKEETGASGQVEHGPKKTSLKRKSGVETKKPKRARLSQSDYTVEQGEDMLLVISNASSQYIGSVWTPKKKGSIKRKAAKGKVQTSPVKKRKPVGKKPKLENKAAKKKNDRNWSDTQTGAEDRWGQDVPEEVLLNIFQMVVLQDGAVPFLCRYHFISCRTEIGTQHKNNNKLKHEHNQPTCSASASRTVINMKLLFF